MSTKNADAATGNTENCDVRDECEQTNLQEEQTNTAEESASADKLTAEPESFEKKYNDLNDSHLRLMAEFDNYRKRTLREKSELIKSGGESALINLLPVIDDFERALQNVREAEDMAAVVQGLELIYNKFTSYLNQQGVKAIETQGKVFDTEMHEAVALVPSPEPESKGYILDCMQTGYTMYDKVIRHSKVVVGE